MGIQQRKEKERQDRRNQILLAAERLFKIKGFGKTKLEDIAKEAELSPGTLYLYFKSKGELCGWLLLNLLQHLRLCVENIVSQADTGPRQRIAALRKLLMETHAFDSPVPDIVFHFQSSEALNSLAPELVSRICETIRYLADAVAEVFGAGNEEGCFTEDSRRLFSSIFWYTFFGVVVWGKFVKSFGGREEDLKNLAEASFEAMWQGMNKQIEKPEIKEVNQQTV